MAFLYHTASNARFPLNAGDELARTAVSDASDAMDFTFDIAFGEPHVLKGKPVIETIQKASLAIAGVIDDFIARGLVS